jgi:hypothetical protein
MGKGSGGLSTDVSSGLQANETALVQLAQQQNQRSGQLFNETFPGLSTAESFYGSLATGDPGAIARATQPATQQITQATQSAKQNIIQNAPAGGEKNLALEMADVNRGAQVGNVTSNAFLSAPNALASLAGQGIGEAGNFANTAISGLGSANSALGNLGSLQIQQYQAQQQAKGSTLGALSSLGGAVFEGAGAVGGFGALFGG